MSYSTIFMVMMMVIALMGWWANYSKRDKIYCSFTNEDKSLIHKFVRKRSRYVVFDGRRYDIVPGCVKTLLWDKGIIGMVFPQRVPALDFTYASRWPIDPATGKHAVISPEVRQAMNKEEWVKSYAKGFTPQAAKKQSMIQQWLPWIAIGLVALLFFYVYTNNQAFVQALSDIANRLNSIAK